MTLPTYRTVEWVAEYLGITYRTALKAIGAGDLRAKKIGKRYLITDEAVAEYLTGQPSAARTGRPSRATGRRVSRGAA